MDAYRHNKQNFTSVHGYMFMVCRAFVDLLCTLGDDSLVSCTCPYPCLPVFLERIYQTITQVMLAIEEVMTPTLKVISATTKVLLAIEEVITATLNVISATTKVILATEK